MFRSTSCSNCLTIHFRHSWRNPLCIKWFDRLNGASTRSGDVIWPNCGRHQDDSKEYTQPHLWEEWGRKSSVSGFYSSDDLMALLHLASGNWIQTEYIFLINYYCTDGNGNGNRNRRNCLKQEASFLIGCEALGIRVCCFLLFVFHPILWVVANIV